MKREERHKHNVQQDLNVKNEQQSTMISILMATLNRADFVLRALHYYKRVGFKGHIIIGDSSNKLHADKINKAIKSFGDSLNITYQYFSNPPYLNIGLCMQEMIKSVETPYVVAAADDDFAVFNGMVKCIQFLEHNSDYVAAHGIRAEFYLNKNGVFGQPVSAHIEKGHDIKSDQASARWMEYVKNAISTQWYVHRTETWRKMHENIHLVKSRHFGDEFVPCSISVISGRIKYLNCITYALQCHTNRHITADFFKIIRKKEWPDSIENMQKIIVQAIVEKDGVDEKLANELFEREFMWYLTVFLQSQYREKYVSPPVETRENVLPTILDPSYEHYPDISKVYRVFTTPLSIDENGLVIHAALDTEKHVESLRVPQREAVKTERKYSRIDNSKKSLCIFLNTYYTAFIEGHYRKNPQLAFEPYEKQKSSLQAEFFGDSDFYSSGLINAGWNAENLIINCAPLQQSWKKEHDFSGEGLDIVIEQIRRSQPEVIYIQDMNLIPLAFLDSVRRYAKCIVGQIATPIVNQIPFDRYDIIFSSFPHYIDRFRNSGLKAYYQPLAFDPRVLYTLNTSNPRHIACSFVGGISRLHEASYQLLEMLGQTTPIEFWGYGAETLPQNSLIHARHHGEAWGKEMFKILSSSRITINRHGEIAENFANNMRLFEATGCGALLITDYKDNLNELFEIGKEIVAYRSAEECAALIKYYLANPEEAAEIAGAGQARTLRDHTYTRRMEQTAEILERHLRYCGEKEHLPTIDLSKISYGHIPIQQSDVTKELTSAWKSDDIPAKQRALVQQEIRDMYKGKPPVVYQVLTECLRPYVFSGCSILEIGCASGYYYEILEYLLNMRISYTGVDYSEALISMAKDYYPKADFQAADGANLPFKNAQFDIAISSGILLHVPNYQQHIKETVRVAQQYVVVHRTPVCRLRPTQYLKKFAYGVETVELRFNDREILSEFVSQRLTLIRSFEYYSNVNADEFEVTYLFRKHGN
jgi:glycosyltransferase domain-containing protein